MDTLENFVGGRYKEADTPHRMEIVDPSTGSGYVLSPISGDSDVDSACRTAEDAFATWRWSTPAERSLALFRIADDLESREEEFIQAEALNTGKPLSFLREEELPMALDNLRFFATLARNLTGVSTGRYVRGYDSTMRREPVGVCACVTPWNYPLAMAVWKIGPVLAAGNTLVLKPSDTTPVTTSMFAEILGDHLPPGVFNVVLGDRDTGRKLVAHPLVDLITVTGSVRAGMEIASSAAGDLKRMQLELGGKAPVLVFGDADIDHTAEGIAASGFINAGQDCAASTRVLAHESIADELTEKLVDRAGRTVYGPPSQAGAEYGPLNNANQLTRVEGFIDRRPPNAEILIGGESDRRDGGYYFTPTVIAGLEQSDEMIQEEIFGPVITVQKFSSTSQAVSMANDVRYGLAGSIWTRSHETALRVSSQLDFGNVWVNCHLVMASEMPNAGFKHSGYGSDLSVYALDSYTRLKHVMSALPADEPGWAIRSG
jgi:betaine-aldehyde dehydrogenase